jgi:hypothetical protein
VLLSGLADGTRPEEDSSATGHQLMIMVTSTIIDPAGNRVYAGDNLPFDPEAVPPQEPFQAR